VILLVTEVSGGGMETAGKIDQIEVTANSLFYRSQTTYCSPEHTTYILLAALILPK
jgi:hypothetical protein